MVVESTILRGRAWTTPAVLTLALIAFTLGGLVARVPSLHADVKKREERPTFKDGGVIANETLQEQLIVLKRIDERVARLENALLEAVKE